MPTATELRELDEDELETRLAEYRRELLNLRFQLATGQLDNISRISEVKKDVARVLTILRDRDIAEAEGREAGPVPAVAPRPPRRRRAEVTDQVAEVPVGSDEIEDEVPVAEEATGDGAVAEAEAEPTAPADADEEEV
jgi:large subunit ribosomal protein L29